MRTKTLLTAAVALAAGITVSNAQVYSANIVGYASIPTPGNGGSDYLMSVPFNIGVSNGANEIWPVVGGVPTLPDYSQILVWNGSGYNTYFSDSTSASGWDDANFTPLAGAPTLPVGQGFFLIPSADVTNVFAGTVAVGIGSTNSTSLPDNGGVDYLVGSAIPYSGSITNGSATGGGVALSSLNGLPDYSQILVWNGSGYATYFSDSTSPSLWDDANFTPLATAPTINVGQGFFLIPSSDFTWTQGLSAN